VLRIDARAGWVIVCAWRGKLDDDGGAVGAYAGDECCVGDARGGLVGIVASTR
jgi:hypothetical protein